MARQKMLMGLVLVGVTTPCVASAPASPEADPGPPKPPVIAPDEAPTATPYIDAKVGIDFTTHYVARGIVQEDQGLIAQPYGEVGLHVTDEVRLFSGIWSSLHSEQTAEGAAAGGIESTTDAWYQFNWYAGVGFELTDDLLLAVNYQEFMSPNDAFGVAKSLQAVVTYDDSGMWGRNGFSLQPYATILAELEGKVGNGDDEGVYAELGVEPAHTFQNGVTLSVPVKIGLGFADFYSDDDRVGYIAGGPKVEIPLEFMGGRYGRWTLAASAIYWHYTDAVEDSNESIGDGDDDIVGTVGISVAY